MGDFRFDPSVNVGHLITIGLAALIAWIANFRRSIERNKEQDAQKASLGKLEALAEQLLDGQQHVQAGISEMRHDLSSVKEQGDRTASTVAQVKESVGEIKADVAGVKSDVEGVKGQMSAMDRTSQQTRHEVNEVAHRVTKLDATVEFLRAGPGVVAPDIERAIARAIAEGRERGEIGRQHG